MYKALKATLDAALDCAGSSLVSPHELRTRFGAVFWPMASERYIESKLRPLSSTSDSRTARDRMESGMMMDEVLRTGQLGAKLEDKARKLGLLDEREGEGPISRYVRDTLTKHADIQRSQRLLRAREVLLRSYCSLPASSSDPEGALPFRRR